MKKELLDKTDADRAEELYQLQVHVRYICGKLSKTGVPAIRKILNDFGADRVSNLKPKYYEDFKNQIDKL